MFDERLKEVAGAVQSCLDRAFAGLPAGSITEGMAYASRGGKRLRAFLVMEGARLHGVDDAASVYAAAAVEAMHAYSLVHDDLPAMDDDDMRRGQPTVHVKWDEAMAILVGDALQALAFDLLTDVRLSPDARVRVDLVRGLAMASGGAGMVRGQALDIAAETAPVPLSLDEITELQALKTGALIHWSAEAGAVLGAADPAPLSTYAGALGLAFQIADDILDVEGDPETTGKRVGKDAEAGKATFVSLLGLDGAKKRARSLIDEAEAALVPYGDKAQALREAARFVISRQM